MTPSAVVDASVVLRWFVEDRWTAAALAAADRFDLIAPAVLNAEVANALRNHIRHGQMTFDRAQVHLGGLGTAISIVDDGPLMPSALRWAIDGDHPVYDCVYLALAAREGIPMLTADMKLARKFAEAPGIQILTLESL